MRLPLFLTCCVVSMATWAQPADTATQVDRLFASWDNATPGGSVLIARGNHIIYHKAFGLADLERLVPNITETIFESGSVAKQFTAFSILLLEQEGKLSQDDDVRKYIPELPTYEAPITIRHLLHHTSGLKDWGSVVAISGWPRTTKVYTLDLALQEIFLQKSLNFRPGDRYSYSNSNYTLLTAIVERVSKQTLQQFTNDRIFQPLGMTNTKWRSNFREIVPRRAQAYSKNKGHYELTMPFENVHGHGGLLTTTGDLLKWNRLLALHQVGGEDVFLKRIERGKLNNGTTIEYAAGIENRLWLGKHKVFTHSGATAGYRAMLMYFPDQQLTIAMLSNDASFSPVTKGFEVASVFFGENPTAQVAVKPRSSVALSEADAKRWKGIYRHMRDLNVIAFDQESNQVLSNGHALKATHSDTLFLNQMTWALRKDGNIWVNNGGDTATYRRVKPIDPKTPLSTYAGEFYSAEIPTVLQIIVKDNGLVLVNDALEKTKLEHLYHDTFRWEGYSLLEFTRNNKNVITGVRVSVPRADNIIFTKQK